MNLTHITQAGERWDALAWRYYGDVRQIGRLVAANPHLPVGPLLPSGARVIIPLLESQETPPAGLPPWRR